VELDRDLVRPNQLRTRLIEYRRSGQAIRNRFGSAEEYEDVARDVRSWVSDISAFINSELGDDTEAYDFVGVGVKIGTMPHEELDQKLDYLRDGLIPKVIQGYW
jgi:hypothetical protein